LAGKRIVITRSAAQSEAMVRDLSARGAIPVVLPLVSFADPEDSAPLDAAIKGIEEFDWMILTSAQAVRALVKRGEELKRSLTGPGSKLRIAAVGPVNRRSGPASRTSRRACCGRRIPVLLWRKNWEAGWPGQEFSCLEAIAQIRTYPLR